MSRAAPRKRRGKQKAAYSPDRGPRILQRMRRRIDALAAQLSPQLLLHHRRTGPLMMRRPFGPTGVQVPVIGQGTWQLRRPDKAEAALRLGLQLGLNHIDTAELYRGSEEIIARAIAGSRDEVFLVSKVLPRNASYKGTLAACDASLRRLRTDRLDVYLLHWWEDSTPLADTMRAFGELLDQGKTRFVGVSNFEVEHLEAAQAHLGRHRIVCNQVYYSPEQRGVEHEVLPYCRRNGIAIVAYSPFGSGRPPARGSIGHRALERVAARRGLTPFQVILAFLARDPAVFVIPKAEEEAHVRENAAALDQPLAPEDLRELEEAFPLPRTTQLPVI